MSLPVRPPTLFAASVAALPTLLAAALAEEETRDRPSDALEDALDDASAAFSLAAPAASDVDEALRRPARRTAKVECRSTWREAARDIVTGSGRGLAMGWMRVGVLGLEVGSFGPNLTFFRHGEHAHGPHREMQDGTRDVSLISARTRLLHSNLIFVWTEKRAFKWYKRLCLIMSRSLAQP
jgi:hypothetical protein